MHSAYPLAVLLGLAILAGCVTQQSHETTYYLEARALDEAPDAYLDWSNATDGPPEIPELLAGMADPTVPRSHNWTGMSLSEDQWNTLDRWIADEWFNQTGNSTQSPEYYPLYYEGQYFAVAFSMIVGHGRPREAA